MKKSLKFLALILVLCLGLSLAACGDNDTDDNTNTPTPGAYDNVKVGVIHIGDPADGSGYSYAHDQGIVGMQTTLGLKDNQIVRKLNIADEDTSAVRTAIEECIAEGCTIIFGTSYGYMNAMEPLAAEHPTVIFSHATGNKSNATNFNNYFGRIYQARYLAGIAAGLKAMEEGSTKIGYVAAYGTELAETCSGINAFALGAQSVNPDATVYVKKLNSWFDPANETAYAEALLAMGCKVIAQHCDTANPQIAAQAAGVWGCGYNSDMTPEAPQGHLTAPIWNWDVYYTEAVKASVSMEKWKDFGNYYGGLAEKFVDISPLSANCTDKTADFIGKARAVIEDGSWDVFSGVALSFDTDGNIVKTETALVDNNGNTIVEAGGASVEDKVIKEDMNYFVKGVELVD